MPRLIPASERIKRARAFIQKARKLPLPADGNKYDLTYIAQVKDLLRQARDLVKFYTGYFPALPLRLRRVRNFLRN